MRRMTIRHLMVAIAASALLMTTGLWVCRLDPITLAGLLFLAIMASPVLSLSAWAAIVMVSDYRWQKALEQRHRQFKVGMFLPDERERPGFLAERSESPGLPTDSSGEASGLATRSTS